MGDEAECRAVLESYPQGCQPARIEPWQSSSGFSGARLWRLQAPCGELCLRRWPAEYPPPERLEFIQAVLWQVDQEGFHQVPVPHETLSHAGYVRHAGHLWELTPWMPGVADYRDDPRLEKLQAALTALAQFHQAASSFPLPDGPLCASPGIDERRQRLAQLKAAELKQLSSAIEPADWPELALRARQLVELFLRTCDRVEPLLDRAARLQVPRQPCIRDVWHDHVLFHGDQVTGLVDFGSMRAESVAADVARLLGSLAADDPTHWQLGLAAYQAVRPLSGDELLLVTAFDRSSVLMSGLQWVDWIYLQGRHFNSRPAVVARLDEIIARLLHLVETHQLQWGERW